MREYLALVGVMATILSVALVLTVPIMAAFLVLGELAGCVALAFTAVFIVPAIVYIAEKMR